MDTPEITVGYIDAGRRFDESLLRLGLDAQGITWLYSRSAKDFILYVITDFFDFKGPIEVSRLFFKAYNASAIPSEINPFNVEFHSGKHTEAMAVLAMVSMRTRNHDGDWDPVPRVWDAKIGDDFLWEPQWTVSNRLFGDRDSVVLTRKWRAFERNVDALAA